MLSEKHRSLLILNGVGLLITSVVAGWLYFLFLLEGLRLFPFFDHIPIEVPGDKRAWSMAHLEGITNGLVLLATGLAGSYIKLGKKAATLLVYSSLTFAWLFTLPAIANAIFDTRGLAYGGGPFEGGLANNLIFFAGYPSFVAVHIAFPLFAYGAWKHYKSL